MHSNEDYACERVLRALVGCGFLFSAKDFTTERRRGDSERTERLIKATEKWAKIAERVASPIGHSLGVDLESRFKTDSFVEFDFNAEALQQYLDDIRPLVELICFKYVVSQPLFTAIIFADGLEVAHQRFIFEKFDNVMLRCRELTFSLHVGFTQVKMTVIGIILWSFLGTPEATHFNATVKETLRKWHFWKKVMTLSWCVDLQQNGVSKHKGPPIILNSVFDTREFMRYLSIPS